MDRGRFHLHNYRLSSHQRGAVLVISLIFLLIMTIIGATAIRSTTLEEKMAGNMRDQDLSFQASEAGLRDAEAWLSRLNVIPEFCSAEANLTSATTCDLYGTADPKVWDNTQYLTVDLIDTHIGKPNVTSNATSADNLWKNKTRSYVNASGTEPDLADVSSDPRILVQYLEFVPDSLVIGPGERPGRHYYRIASRGFGGTDTTESILESAFTRKGSF